MYFSVYETLQNLNTAIKQSAIFYSKRTYYCSLLAHLFVNKVSRPGGEVTFSVFESSCHLLLPV